MRVKFGNCFGCSFGGEEGPEVRVRIITKSEPYLITRD